MSEKKKGTFSWKIQQIQKSVDDSMFQEGLARILEDFLNVDLEGWGKDG